MSDKSPRQGMSKKSSKSIKEKRAEKRAKGHTETPLRDRSTRRRSGEPAPPRASSAGRPRRTSTGCPSTPTTWRASTPTSRPRSPSSTGTARRSAAPTTDLAPHVGGFASRERDPRAVRRGPAAQAAARGRRRAARRADAVGLAALRAGRRADPARHRPAADPDRVRGDEPLDPRPGRRPARVPQEQRARRLLLGPARAPAGRLHRRLRPPAHARP